SEGGPYETPFIHADEVETSWSLALFPEVMRMEDVADTTPRGFLPEGHIDMAGNLLHRPVAWYGQVGCGPIEVAAYKPGVVGKASAARAEKAIPGVEKLLDYMVKLVTDVVTAFPPGRLPPIEEVTQRPREEIEAVLKGPLAPGGRSIYTLAYPM
ncbi:MAG: creatininase family protein, partial [Chloroflexi bacterium]|nr:creatininase family protein [Chloroflexota bacterium]